MRVLCLILASDTDPVYLQFQERWRKYMHSNPDVTSYFYKGDPALDTETRLEGDTLWIKISESLDTVYEKTLRAFSHFAPIMPSYDFVIRPNLSSVVSFPHLLEYCKCLPRQNCCSGLIGRLPREDEIRYGTGPGFVFPAGSGYILSSDVAIRLANERPMRVIQDDVSVGVALREWGIPIVPFSRIDNRLAGFWITNDGVIHDLSPSETRCFYRLKTEDRMYDLRSMDTILRIVYGI